MLDMSNGVEFRSAVFDSERAAGQLHRQLGWGLGIWSLAFGAALAIKIQQGHASEPIVAAFATALCVVLVAALRAWRDRHTPPAGN